MDKKLMICLSLASQIAAMCKTNNFERFAEFVEGSSGSNSFAYHPNNRVRKGKGEKKRNKANRWR